MEGQRINTTNQYLSFRLADEVYGIDITQVREVLEFSTVTRVPRVPEFMRGVINLRGGVVPVIDLRLKFGMGRTEKTVNTCVIITEVAVDDERTVLGAMADSVQEVLELEPSQIEPPPKIGMRLKNDFIKGMGKYNDNFIILIDVDRVFSAEELAIVAETGKAGSMALGEEEK
jgi:purine-binding chemotaxis protein CheW